MLVRGKCAPFIPRKEQGMEETVGSELKASERDQRVGLIGTGRYL